MYKSSIFTHVLPVCHKQHVLNHFSPPSPPLLLSPSELNSKQRTALDFGVAGAGADARDTSTSYPCYKATCAGNATCCHYGEADMCCWNGGGGVAGPVSWLCAYYWQMQDPTYLRIVYMFYYQRDSSDARIHAVLLIWSYVCQSSAFLWLETLETGHPVGHSCIQISPFSRK